MDDESIIGLYWLRDERAIAETAEKYGAYCLRIALNILSVLEDAEECVNDTWNSAWAAMPPKFPRALGAFLGRITRNRCIDRFRASRAAKRSGMEIMLSELSECIPSPNATERQVELNELSELLNRWLAGLEADDRALFTRRYFFGDTVKALAEECGVSSNRMAQRMLRLRLSLKACLEQEGYII